MIPSPTRRLIGRLRLPQAPLWGFIIYRTTYTPQSYHQFPRIIELPSSFIKREILHEYETSKESYAGAPKELKNDYQLICAKHHPIIIEDRTQLNSISLHGVRSHFESWIDDHVDGRGRENHNWGYSTQRHVCLVVDEEVCQTLGDADARLIGGAAGEYLEKWWVKAVEPWPEIDEWEREATGFDGTMKVSVFDLFRLWTHMDDPYPMWMMRRDANGLYTG
jgi:hypothetical protein